MKEDMSLYAEDEIVELWRGGSIPNEEASRELIKFLGWTHLSASDMQEILRSEEGRKEVFQQVLNSVVYNNAGRKDFQNQIKAYPPHILREEEHPDTSQEILRVLNAFYVVESWDDSGTEEIMKASFWANQAHKALRELVRQDDRKGRGWKHHPGVTKIG